MLKTMQVIFNGRLYSEDDPTIQISPFSSAIQFGNSVFESMRTYNGRAPRALKFHWERLFLSAQTIKLDLPNSLSQESLDKGLNQLLGSLDLSQDYRLKVLANSDFWWIKAFPLPPLPASVYQLGVCVGEAHEVRELSRAKCASPLYPYYQKVHQETGVFETLYFSADNQLLEGSVSSVIAVINNTLRTPQDKVLPGVTVRQILAQAAALELPIEMGPIYKSELKQASEILLTNAVKGLVPVRKWGKWERASSHMYDQLKKQTGEL